MYVLLVPAASSADSATGGCSPPSLDQPMKKMRGVHPPLVWTARLAARVCSVYQPMRIERGAHPPVARAASHAAGDNLIARMKYHGTPYSSKTYKYRKIYLYKCYPTNLLYNDIKDVYRWPRRDLIEPNVWIKLVGHNLDLTKPIFFFQMNMNNFSLS